MIPQVEHIGAPTWPRRVRLWFNDLFGSRYVKQLERDLVQARLDRDRAWSEMKAAQERLLEVMAATKGIPIRPFLPPDGKPKALSAALPPTRWEQVQAAAIAENAKAEEEERKKAEAELKTKEN